MKTRCSPSGDEKSAFKHQTTQTSFSRRCAGRPELEAATPSASRRSASDRFKNLSDTQFAYRFGKPSRQRRSRRLKFTHFGWSQFLTDGPQCTFCRPGTDPRKRTHHLTCTTVGQGKLPTRRMLELDNLLAEVEFARRTGGQINLTNRYLRCQTKVVGASATCDNLSSSTIGGYMVKSGRPITKGKSARPKKSAVERTAKTKKVAKKKK